MGLEKLKRSLIAEATSEADMIISSAEKEAKAILEEDRKSIDAAKERIDAELDVVLAAQRQEKTAATRLEAKRLISEAKEDVLNAALDDFFIALKDLRDSSEYKKFLSNRVAKASEEISGELIVHVPKGDKELLPKSKNITIKEDLDSIGGILIENASGKIRLNYTLETLIEKEKDELRKKLYESIFGGKK